MLPPATDESGLDGSIHADRTLRLSSARAAQALGVAREAVEGDPETGARRALQVGLAVLSRVRDHAGFVEAACQAPRSLLPHCMPEPARNCLERGLGEREPSRGSPFGSSAK